MKANQTSNATGVQIFHFENAHQVRTNLINGEPWFVARDVCDILGLQNGRRAAYGLDEDERYQYVVRTLKGDRPTWHVNESGLYALIFQSRKPAAKKFRKWVTSEVLPSLRKTGSYSVDQSGEIERLKAEVQHATTRYNSYRAQMCRLRKRGEAIPRANALIAPVPAVPVHGSPVEKICGIIRDVWAAQIDLENLHDSEDGAVLQDIPHAYIKACNDLGSAITGMSEYIGLCYINSLPVS